MEKGVKKALYKIWNGMKSLRKVNARTKSRIKLGEKKTKVGTLHEGED